MLRSGRETLRVENIEYRADGVRMVGEYVVDDASAGRRPGILVCHEGNAAIPTPDTTPRRTEQFIKDELAKWAPVIRAADVKIS